MTDLIQPTNPMKLLEHVDKLKDLDNATPVCVHIHPTDMCQDDCKFCCAVPYRSENKFKGLPLDRTLETIEQLKEMKVKSIQFSGGGEPMLHKGFDEMFLSAKSFCDTVGVVTNGGMLAKHHEILLTGASLRISVNACTAENFEFVQTAGKQVFKQRLKIVREFLSDSNRTSSAGVGFVFNEHTEFTEYEFLSFLNRLYESGLDFFSMRPEFSLSGKNDLIQEKFESKEPIFRRAKELFPSCMITSERMNGVWGGEQSRGCSITNLHTILSASGKAYLCCAMKHSYGNFLEKDFKDLWFDERLKMTKSIDPRKDKRCEWCVLSQYNKFIEQYNDEANRIKPALNII